MQLHQQFVRWMNLFFVIFGFIVDLKLRHFVTNFLAVFQAADQLMIISVRVDYYLNVIDCVFNFALLIFHYGKDLTVLVVIVGELWFDRFKN